MKDGRIQCAKCGKVFLPIGSGRWKYCGQCRDGNNSVRKEKRRHKNFRCLANKCIKGTSKRRGGAKCSGCEWNSRNYRNAYFRKKVVKIKKVLTTLDKTYEGSLPIEIVITIKRGG